MMSGRRYILAACLLLALLATGFACWPAGGVTPSNGQAKDVDLGGLQNSGTQLDPYDVRAARSFVDNTTGDASRNASMVPRGPQKGATKGLHKGAYIAG